MAVSPEFHDLEKLHFDPLNPRLPAGIDGTSDKEVFKWMLSDATLVELMRAIGQLGYFPGEAVLGVPLEGKKGHYTIVEGNRRLAAVRLLSNPGLAPAREKAVQQASKEALNKPDRLPLISFPKRDNILMYLGYRHVTGVKEWDPLAKARYLNQLLHRNKRRPKKEAFQELAKSIGSRSDYVATLLTGFAVYNKIEESNFFDIDDLDERSLGFSILTTALSYENIAKHFLKLSDSSSPDLRGLNLDRLKELTEWMFKKDRNGRSSPLGESRNLKWLNQIVVSPAALQAFRAGTPIDEAYFLAGGSAGDFEEALTASMNNLRLARDHMHRVTQPTPQQEDMAKEIEDLARAIRNYIRGSNVKSEQGNQ